MKKQPQGSQPRTETLKAPLLHPAAQTSARRATECACIFELPWGGAGASTEAAAAPPLQHTA